METDWKKKKNSFTHHPGLVLVNKKVNLLNFIGDVFNIYTGCQKKRRCFCCYFQLKILALGQKKIRYSYMTKTIQLAIIQAFHHEN